MVSSFVATLIPGEMVVTHDPRHPRDILRLLDESQHAGGIFLADTIKFPLIEAVTDTCVYLIAPIDRRSGAIAVQSTGPFAHQPILAIFSGSTWGGSAIRLQWFGVGMYLEFYLGRWSTATSSLVRSIVLRPDPARAKALILTAIRRKP